MGTVTNFPDGASSFGVPMVGGIGGLPLGIPGTSFYCAPAIGNDGNDGLSPSSAFATLYKAHAAMTAGKNDVCYFLGDGGTTGTARLSAALAASVTSSATTGTLTWSKNACHLIGVTAPSVNFQRARIAPPSGTYTQSTFGSGNFVVVSASGCIFANFSLFNGFSTGGTNQICWTVTGSRNYHWNINFGGMADATSAADAGSRSVKIGSGGSGENTFDGCTFGIDTVTRSAANASLEFAGATPRNVFRNCIFPFMTSSATVLGIIGTGAENMDRYQLFDQCKFINCVGSTSTTMSGLSTLAASSGGICMFYYPTLVGISEFGTDATSRAQCWVDGAAATAGTSGIAVQPT